MQPIVLLSLSTITAGSNYNMSNSKIDISVNNNHIYQVKDLRSGKDLENNLNLGWDLGDWESYGLSWSQFAFQNLQVVAQGPVRTVIVANYNASTYGFYAQEYYTLDYLDDVIQMQIVVTNTGSATLPEGNWLGFYSDWSPGYGTTDTALTAPGYGVGGFNFTGSAFMNTTIDNSSDFVTPGQTALRSLSPSPFAATTVGMQQASWYVEYNTQVNQGVGTIWNPQTSIDQIHTFISEIGDRGTNGANTTREGVMSFRIVPQQLAAGASMSFTFYGEVLYGSTGYVTELRASGLQNPPQAILGTTSVGASSNVLEVSCVDNNSAIVSGAYIQLTNQAGQDARLLKADSSGNAYFRALYYGIWNVLINYSIGTMNYTVLNTSISTITGPAWIFTYTAVCNLTTVSLCEEIIANMILHSGD